MLCVLIYKKDPATVLSLRPSSPSSSTPALSSSSQSPSSTTVGPIAGGVVWGIAILTFVISLTWFCMRRRWRRTKAELRGEVDTAHEKLGNIVYRSEAAGESVHEMEEHGSGAPGTELATGQQLVKLDGADTRQQSTSGWWHLCSWALRTFWMSQLRTSTWASWLLALKSKIPGLQDSWHVSQG
jgi:hypothetical protein